MFLMQGIESSNQLSFSSSSPTKKPRKPRLSQQITKVIDAVEPLNPFTRRHQQIRIMIDHYRRENKRLRKPCPICNTLVKPELQQQHNDAYHPE